MLTKELLQGLIASHDFETLQDGQTVVCTIKLHTGFRVIGYAPGPMDPANWNYETGCDIAYRQAFEQLWQLEAYRVTAEAFIHPAESVPQRVLDLPPGSAVFEIVPTVVDGVQDIAMQGIITGGMAYDPTSPAHRILAAINNNIDLLVQQAGGGPVNRDNNVQKRIASASAALSAPYGEGREVSADTGGLDD